MNETALSGGDAAPADSKLLQPLPRTTDAAAPRANAQTLLDIERDVVRGLSNLVVESTQAANTSDQAFERENSAAEHEFQACRQELLERNDTEQGQAEVDIEEARSQAQARYQNQVRQAEQNYQQAREQVQASFEVDHDNANRALEEARWETTALYEAGKKGAKQQFEETQEKLTKAAESIQDLLARADDVLRKYRQESLLLEPDQAGDAVAQPAGAWSVNLSPIEGRLATLQSLGLARSFEGLRPASWLFGLWLAFALPAWFVSGGQILVAATATLVAGTIAWGILFAILHGKAKSQVRTVYFALRQAARQAEIARRQCRRQSILQYRKQRNDQKARRKEHRGLAVTACEHRRGEIVARCQQDLRRLEEERVSKLNAAAQERDRTLAQAEQAHEARVSESKVQYQIAWHEMHDRYRERRDACHERHERESRAVREHWDGTLSRCQSHRELLDRTCEHLFPHWDDPQWPSRPAPTAFPPVLRFGEMHVVPASADGTAEETSDEVAMIDARRESTRESDARFQLTDFWLPALVGFPSQSSFLWKTSGAGRDQAINSVQSVMLRLLTAVPPGKCRFTIIDPVGLGQNFAAFMHLADYDEALVTGKIWTEPGHIEQRLADLSEQMETVIQKYLRNEFATIEEYNAQAGEVSEPLRFLVVANFPTNFSEAAARRLVSIASTGARCGVRTLITVDMKQPLPPGFQLHDLEQHAATLVWRDKRFQWKHADYQHLPLCLEQTPADETFTRLVKQVGERAKAAKRVEVPFDRIAPRADEWWTRNSAAGIDVPLGPSGATKRQSLNLGSGTAQHVLVAGKTGSGKSTLLHALITNLAMFYSPDQIELYLVDFKKGVEFKTYATHRLAHARVIAIESDREFGLSVLQRLDAELKSRGDRFRALGVQGLAGFRQAAPETPLPRIMLVIDEFQELFVEDDKLAQESALLLDRLVRQGRAFGIHVLLGSQTLGGAYSLARSTLGQMAVRIALQCSEADAHLILSEENSAARLLSRPGEAIYNDAGGLIEANQPFQVAWLGDDRKEDYLRAIRELAEQRGYAGPTPIVFEGNVPAEIANNTLLRDVLQAAAPPTHGTVPRGWLGEAVAIKDPTCVEFRRQSGSNLLIVGQHGEAAQAMFCTTLVSLAAQTATGARSYIVDGSPLDSESHQVFRRLARVPTQSVQVHGWRELPGVLNEVASELDRRQQAHETDAAPIFLFLHDLGRLRDLRRQEDDFGFSRGENAAASPSQQFSTILKEGPGLGIHTLVWCDSWNNLQRTLERQGLREFEMRILFQMSAADSSNLVDSPIASRLGMHRALFSNEEEGRMEKFRPYSVPREGWLCAAEQQLRLQRTESATHAQEAPAP